MAPTRSKSGLRLSNVQTETRLLVTLCDAGWTRHNPMIMDATGAFEGVGGADGPGVDVLLPVLAEDPIL